MNQFCLILQGFLSILKHFRLLLSFVKSFLAQIRKFFISLQYTFSKLRKSPADFAGFDSGVPNESNIFKRKALNNISYK